MPLFLFLLCLLFLISIPFNSSNPCFASFPCGNVEISYPFSLLKPGSSSSYCGYPGLFVSCQDNTTPILNLVSNNYTITHINYATQAITVADTDVLESTINCPRVQHNLSFFPHFPLNYTQSDVNLTFFFNCSPIPPEPSPITCLPGYSYVFRSDQISSYEYTYWSSICQEVVVTPVSNNSLVKYENNLTYHYGPMLKNGFDLQWSMSSDDCHQCESNGGQCGYTQISDTNFTSTCFYTNKKKNKTGVIVGVSVAGAIFLFLLFVFLFFCIRKRKQKKNQSTHKMLVQPETPPHSTVEPQYMHSKDLNSGSITLKTHLFSYQELEEATNGFDASRELGDGGFGTVYKGKLRDGRTVAIKRLYEHNYRRMEQFMNEVEILTRIQHPNLVSLYGCTSRQSQELLLVYEFVPNGTVADHLHGPRADERKLTWNHRLAIAIEAADALAYLHAVEPPIVHRDVKTTNILLDVGFHVKVADFGLSRLFPLDVTHVSTMPQGTPGYVDPEYHKCYQLTDKSDVYSFGVVLVELISSMPAVDLTRHRSDINLACMAMNMIQKSELDQLVDPRLGFESNPAVKKMITMVAELAFRCLQPDGDMRPPLKEVLEALIEIEKEGRRIEKGGNMEGDTGIEDDKGLLKSVNIAPSSPDSVTVKWVSRTTTPNTSE